MLNDTKKSDGELSEPVVQNDTVSRHDYVVRVNRAIDLILQNLDQDLSLQTLSKAASFSPFHFHRIFQGLVGETPNQFVKRVRLERAVAMMSTAAFQGTKPESLTHIALECGFSSSSDFSRSFKQRFGVAPSEFNPTTFRKDRREEWQSVVTDSKHRYLLDGLQVGENPDGFEVKVRPLPARCVAYIRVSDPYRDEKAVPDAAARLVAWAEERGLAGGQWLGYMWDNPEITAPEDCRYDVGLEVPEIEPSGEICRIDFPAMQVAEVELRGPIDLEMRALDWLYRTWLPQSGYSPANHPGFEAWIGRPFAHGMAHFELFAQIPIERG